MSSREHQSVQPAAAALSMSASPSRKRKIDSDTQGVLYGAAVTVDVADVGPDAPSGVISVDDSDNSSADKDPEELIIKKKLQYERVKAVCQSLVLQQGTQGEVMGHGITVREHVTALQGSGSGGTRGGTSGGAARQPLELQVGEG